MLLGAAAGMLEPLQRQMTPSQHHYSLYSSGIHTYMYACVKHVQGRNCIREQCFTLFYMLMYYQTTKNTQKALNGVLYQSDSTRQIFEYVVLMQIIAVIKRLVTYRSLHLYYLFEFHSNRSTVKVAQFNIS